MNFKFVDFWLNILNSYKFVFVISVKVMVCGKIEYSIIRIYFLLILFIILIFQIPFLIFFHAMNAYQLSLKQEAIVTTI